MTSSVWNDSRSKSNRIITCFITILKNLRFTEDKAAALLQRISLLKAFLQPSTTIDSYLFAQMYKILNTNHKQWRAKKKWKFLKDSDVLHVFMEKRFYRFDLIWFHLNYFTNIRVLINQS